MPQRINETQIISKFDLNNCKNFFLQLLLAEILTLHLFHSSFLRLREQYMCSILHLIKVFGTICTHTYTFSQIHSVKKKYCSSI